MKLNSADWKGLVQKLAALVSSSVSARGGDIGESLLSYKAELTIVEQAW